MTWISLSLLGLQCLGWLAIFATVWLFPGGHPPLSAYVGICVLLAQLGLAPAGIVTAALGIRRRPERRWPGWLALAGNTAFALQALWLLVLCRF